MAGVKNWAMVKSGAAKTAPHSNAAYEASTKATEYGKAVWREGKGSHEKAIALHEKAAGLHDAAAKVARENGFSGMARRHEKTAEAHRESVQGHKDDMETAPPTGIANEHLDLVEGVMTARGMTTGASPASSSVPAVDGVRRLHACRRHPELLGQRLAAGLKRDAACERSQRYREPPRLRVRLDGCANAVVLAA